MSIYKSRQRRAGAVLVLWLSLAACIALFSHHSDLAMALAFPGAGFWLGAAAGHWMPILAAFLSHAFFALSILLWFGSGNAVAPVLAWAITIIVTLVMRSHGHAAPASLLFVALPFLIWPAVVFGWRFLSPRSPHTDVRRPHAIRATNLPIDHNEALTGLSRFAFDRALQPLDQFEGFQFVDQFQTAALRYQLNQMGYALALLQRQQPAFRGYLHQAQVNLILKAQDHRVWRYWQLENMWGNLSSDPNPVARDNIMFTGFLAAQIALFQAASGDKQFSQPKSLVFTHKNGTTYTYDQNGLIDALHHGWDSSAYHLMPCEPNWIYPLCNGIGGCAAHAADPARWTARSDDFQAALLREFTSVDGTILPFRSAHTGIPGPAAGGAVVLAYPMLFWNTLYPDMAADLWTKARAASIQDGVLNTAFFWKVDTGDYRRSRAISYSGFAAAAAEMGDQDARDLALRALEQEVPAHVGPWHRPNASVFAHMTELIARLNTGGTLSALFGAAAPAQPGPQLDTHDRNVLVRRADIHEGAVRLDLTVCAPSDLPFIGFTPNAPLTVGGTIDAQVTADAQGHAQLRLDTAGDYSLRISS